MNKRKRPIRGLWKCNGGHHALALRWLQDELCPDKPAVFAWTHKSGAGKRIVESHLENLSFASDSVPINWLLKC